MKLSSANQVHLLVVLLFCVGLGAAAYKHLALGFPLLASETETVWQLEGKIVFDAKPGMPVEVRLNLPDNNPSRRLVSSDFIAPGFNFDEIEEEGARMARWRGEGIEGEQVILLRSLSYFPDTEDALESPLARPLGDDMDGPLRRTGLSLLRDIQPVAGIEGALQIMRSLNQPGEQRVEILLRGNTTPEKRTYRMGQVLALAGYQVEPVGGIFLEDKSRSQTINHFLEVFIDGRKWLLDTRELEIIPWDRIVLLQRNKEPLLEVFGGKDSRVTYATNKLQRATFASAVDAASHAENPLIDFSIYSLPLSEQNTFKLLLVIPLGALVVVILRNLVGLRTSGTFMPVLIALTFLQTTLVVGVMLFIVVVGVGLILRSYLSHLNLLLVPRIASVLVFVIIIYGAIGILSAKMGWQGGLKVTFFPMIILSWTIERMSILWDEAGPREVMVESGGSLVTASLAYLLMGNTLISDTIFLYPELLLVILAVIIAIGSYTGYRLSDLRRFEPLERHD